MSKKLEKLKEINFTIKKMLAELETKFFIENVDDDKKIVVEETSNVITFNLKNN